jgi:hypothetical protein
MRSIFCLLTFFNLSIASGQVFESRVTDADTYAIRLYFDMSKFAQGSYHMPVEIPANRHQLDEVLEEAKQLIGQTYYDQVHIIDARFTTTLPMYTYELPIIGLELRTRNRSRAWEGICYINTENIYQLPNCLSL